VTVFRNKVPSQTKEARDDATRREPDVPGRVRRTDSPTRASSGTQTAKPRRPESEHERRPDVSRRNLLHRASKAAALALVACGEGIVARPRSAEAASPMLYSYGCCRLAHRYDYQCPTKCRNKPGYHLRYWTCVGKGSSNGYKCYECAAGSNCGQGPFYCSYYETYR
jgi:hypothetical protein